MCMAWRSSSCTSFRAGRASGSTAARSSSDRARAFTYDRDTVEFLVISSPSASGDRQSYYEAFEAIERDPNNELAVAGLGRKLVAWAIERARARNCRVVQLTSDKTRADAIRFYESLGLVASREGLKLHLSHADPR
jgi:hypothetical protein